MVVAFTVTVEVAIERMQHAAAEVAKVYSDIGSKVGKELMILGMISFAIFAGREGFQLHETAWALPLEFAHVVILGAAFMYVMSSFYFLISMRRACRHYDNALHASAR